MQHSKKLYEKGILKNKKMLTQSQYADFRFMGRLDHIKNFYAGIKALSFGEVCSDVHSIYLKNFKKYCLKCF